MSNDAQTLANLFGCLEHYAYHAKAATDPAVKALDAQVEDVARKIAARFEAAHPDLEPLIKDVSDGKDFRPFTKTINPKEADMGQKTTSAEGRTEGEKPTEEQSHRTEEPTLPGHVARCMKSAAAHCMKMYSHDALKGAKNEDLRAECYHHAKALEHAVGGDEEEGMEHEEGGGEEEPTGEEKALIEKELAEMARVYEANEKTLAEMGVN